MSIESASKPVVSSGLVEELLDLIYIPEANCSCHISPPCADCVDHAGMREIVSTLRTAISASRAEPSKEIEWEAAHGYQEAFYKIADLLGIGEMVSTPAQVFASVLVPKLRSVLADHERYRFLRDAKTNEGFWIAYRTIQAGISRWTGGAADAAIDKARIGAAEAT